jgi:isocitrate/isopropylmalate dehydrogenase
MIRVAVLPGDGIGSEVLAGPMALAQRMAATGAVSISGPWPIGASAFMACGEGLPASTLAACEAADAILFGAVGDHPGFDPTTYRPELALLALREHFDLRISIRQVWRGDRAPWTVVRNLLGGAYGSAAMREESDGQSPAVDHVRLAPDQIAEVVEIACGYATGDGMKLVSVDKANLLATSRLWRKVAAEIARRRGIDVRHALVDQYAHELGKRELPDEVVVTEGLFGDILSDLAAARAGSIALCGSASVHPGDPHRGRCAGLFEPVHGTAPDIVGRGIANPAGGYLALAALLEWFPETRELAARARRALAAALRDGPLTRDLAPAGSSVATTEEFAERVTVNFATETQRH